MPSGVNERSNARPALARQRASSANAGLPHTRIPATWLAMYDARSVAGGPVSRAAASGLERMYSGSPVVDITDVIDSSRSGCSMAMVWTIIPPIDRPITCARSTPQASSTASASRAMSDRRYAAPWSSVGAPAKDVESPTSRLSKRITWNPRAANISHHSSA